MSCQPTVLTKSMPHVTTLAHLSDIHLFSGLPRGRQWLSKQGFSAINWLTTRRFRHKAAIGDKLLADLIAAQPDMIAMGGDLINFGTALEFEASRSWLDRLSNIAPLMSIPGNHEAMAPGWRKNIRGWGKHFAFCDDHAPIIRIQGHIGLIGVSTARATPPFWASGRVGQKHCERMGELIGFCHEKGVCPVILMHHPPTKLSSRRRGLADWRNVCHHLAKAGPVLVLHGHLHLAKLSWINGRDGIIPVLGIPSFSQIDHDDIHSGAWRLLTIGQQDNNWIITMTEHTVTKCGAVQKLTPIRLLVKI